ncbi:tripartite tricarboxylate transporter TctB family protein [Bradyrhizobium sp. SRS-191]|uniref:tripartite tricarboxylate transporter TctB family protein n=1 Tax=Bradyrhizobium sp. SRS-191 TaxID=2962606 RepID=UPI00211DDFD7|nr:tripartite tricarboxylate transporter TctB family protein [Bradyrhizobium sp. SRS-191]
MAETTGQLSGGVAREPAARSVTGASIILVLAFAPQLIELLIALAGLVGPLSGRGPLQVIGAHASALSTALPSLAQQYAAGSKASLSSDVLLALIYTYPLIAVAVFTFMVRPRGPQDYFGGVVLMAIALFALWASSDLQGMRGFSFGAGTAPRMFGLLLLGLGAAIAVIGVVNSGAQLATYHWRGPLFVSLAILTFAVSIRPLGLLITGLASFLIAAIGSPETRWREAVIVGVCLTAGCALLFPYVLGLAMPLWPRFLLQ